MFVMLPVGAVGVAAGGTTGVGVLKVSVELHGPAPALLHVCTFQVKVPTARPGVAPATEHVLAPQTAAPSYHFVKAKLEGPLTESWYQVDSLTLFHW